MRQSTRFRTLASPIGLLLVALTIASLAGQAGAQGFAPAADLTNAVQQNVIGYLGYQPTTEIIVANVQQQDNWAFGTVAIAAVPAEGATPTALLFLAQYVASRWEVALEPTPQFQSWLQSAPDSVMPGEVRTILSVTPSLAGNGSGELGLPWATGESWYLTSGPHIAVDGNVRNALDFAGGSGQIRAARDGIVSVPCANYVQVRHGGGWMTTYYHVANIAVSGGQNVARGGYIGNISAQTGCGGSATGPHVHFATYLNNADKAMHGLDLGGWTVENGSSAYSGCMVRIRDGARQCSSRGQIYNDGSIGSGAPPNQAPNKPSLATPADGARVPAGSVRLEWRDNGDPDNQPRNYRDYAVEIYRDGAKVAESGWITGTSWTISSLSAGNYEWRMQSGDGIAASGWTGSWRFTLGNPPPEVVCDNQSACFSKYESSGAWGYVQPGTGDSSTAYRQHAFWTYISQHRALDWGKWQPGLPYAGTYNVYVWYPQTTLSPAATAAASYQIHHAGGDTTIAWSQAANAGKWNKLATVRCSAGSSCFVKLSDSASESTSSRRIWFDAVKFVFVANPQITISPLQVTRGSQMNESGSGFTPNGPLHMSIRLPNGSYYEEDLQADAGGNFFRLYTMPTNAQLGRYAFRILDVSSGIWSNTAEFTVENVPVFAISGQVRASDGRAIAGVMITTAGRSAMTASDGSYTLSELVAGSYTLSAAKTGCTFTPASRTVTVPSTTSGQSFTASCDLATTNQPPNRPALLTPEHASTINNATPTFTWRDNGDPDNSPQAIRTFRVRLLHVDGAAAGESGWLSGTSWTAPALSDGTYTWQVQAYDGAAVSDWTGTRNITVATTSTPGTPYFQSNYRTGGPGSTFTLTLGNVTPGVSATVALQAPGTRNFRTILQQPIAANGRLVFGLHFPTAAAPGSYNLRVTVADGSTTAAQSVDLAALSLALPLRIVSDAAIVNDSPPNDSVSVISVSDSTKIFLPFVKR